MASRRSKCRHGRKLSGGCKRKPGSKRHSRRKSRKSMKSRRSRKPRSRSSSRCRYGRKLSGGCKRKPGSKKRTSRRKSSPRPMARHGGFPGSRGYIVRDGRRVHCLHGVTKSNPKRCRRTRAKYGSAGELHGPLTRAEDYASTN